MPEERLDEDVVRRAASIGSLYQLGQVLRQLKRREARGRRGPELTHRQIATRTGWSVASVNYYLNGSVLPPIDRFDELVRVLGATAEERSALADARDRLAESRRPYAGGEAATVDGGPPVRTLPAPPSMFVGRVAQLAYLDEVLARHRSGRPVTVISGLGGVGKTALALHWAHRSIHQFPDGQLYVNLRGFDPGEHLTVGEALRHLLTALGLAPTEVPSTQEERIARYHGMLAGRRVLVLLDNAADAEQVRPLLPPEPCVALVTSRNRLHGQLAAAPERRQVDLDVLTEDEATELFRRLIGPLSDHDPLGVRAMALRCGYLPLAIRVVAELAARRSITLAQLVEELTVASGDAFGTGDVRSDICIVFSWSLRSMPPAAIRAFYLVGLAPGETIDTFVVAALAGVDPAEANVLLDTLARAHLIQAVRLDRYTVNDLVRAYAVEMVTRELDPADRRAAIHRLLDYYVAAAAAATGSRQRPLDPRPVSVVHLPDLSAPESARAWLAAEHQALVRVRAAASSLGFPAHARALEDSLSTSH